MGFFDLYKRGQGLYARVTVAALLGLLACFGIFELYSVLGAWEAKLFDTVAWKLIVVALTALVAAVVVFLAVNGGKAVDFLIMTEAELRKVSWPTRRQLRQQTLVVIVVTVIFGAVIQIADWIFVQMNMAIFM